MAIIELINPFMRRYYTTRVALVLLSGFLCCQVSLAQQTQPIKLSWLGDKAPGLKSGISWGVPFAKGTVSAKSNYSLSNDKGEAIPVQSWPMAYWPDGTIKWVGLSAVIDSTSGTSFQLRAVKASAKKSTSSILTETENGININTGVLQGTIAKKGTQLLSALTVNNKVVCDEAQLVTIVQHGQSTDVGSPVKEK